MKSCITTGLALLSLAGLAAAGQWLRTQAPPHPKTASAKTADSPNVIGFLEGRSDTITLKCSRSGPVYSAVTRDGRIRFHDLSAKQLEVQAPDVHRVIKMGIAGPPVGRGPFIDINLRQDPMALDSALEQRPSALDASAPVR